MEIRVAVPPADFDRLAPLFKQVLETVRINQR
jgi:hypothetical protein